MKTPILPLPRSTVLFALLLALAPQSVATSEPLAKITVEAGKHTRIGRIKHRLSPFQQVLSR